jgi:scyllo-inositol 2-dehydrogenase (NADP+)
MIRAENPIKTGILSFGMSGQLFHAPFLNIHQGFELRAVVERTKKKAQTIYSRITSYNSIEELIADPEIELVIINTPNATHCDFALKAIRSGKHVLVEKPFTVTFGEAKQIFAEAGKYNVLALPYQNRRYDSDFLSVKNVIDSGKLGRLVEVHIRFDRYRYVIGPKVEKETPVPGSGLFYDLGPHLLDAVISLFGNPLQWRKSFGHFRPNTQVDDYAHIHLIYPDELQVYLTMSMLVADAQPAYVLNGTKGTYIKERTDIQEKQLLTGMAPDNSLYGIEEAGKDGILTVIADDGTKTQENIKPVKSSYLNLFDSVYKTIREGKDYPTTHEQILKQIEILER